jgi:hypothetical protein
VVALQLLGWAGSALLVFSVLQTRILRLRIFGGVASAVLVIFNAAIAVWPMVAMNVVLTAINVFYIVRLLRTRHDPETFDVVEISPQEKYVRYLLNQFAADVQRFNPGFSADNARTSRPWIPRPSRSGDCWSGPGPRCRRRHRPHRTGLRGAAVSRFHSRGVRLPLRRSPGHARIPPSRRTPGDEERR